MQIHELNDFTDTLGSGSFLAIDNGTDTGKVSAKTLVAGVENEINELDAFLNGRIDNIIAGGSAPSEAEIIDARYGADGITYPSLGDAIRGQVSDLKSGINELPYLNTYDSSAISTGHFIDQYGTVQDTDGWNVTDYLPVDNIHDYKYLGITTPGGAPYSAYYTENKAFISTFKQQTGENVLVIPRNCAFVRFSLLNADVASFRFYKNTLATKADLEDVQNDYSPKLWNIIHEGNFGKVINVTGTSQSGFWNIVSKEYASSANFATLLVDYDDSIRDYLYSGFVINQLASGIVYLDASNNLIGYDLPGNADDSILYSNYLVHINAPYGTAKIGFSSYIGTGGASLAVKQFDTTNSIYSEMALVVTGDSIETEEAGMWSASIAKLIDWKSYTNKAVGGTCMAKSSETDDTYIASDERMSAMPASADIVLVGGGTNDWANNVPLGDLTTLNSDTNFAGAVYSLISKLQTKYPNALLVFTSNQNTCSPNRHNFDDATGWTNNLGFSAADYASMMEKVCKFASIPYIDTNHECAINRLNYTSYLLEETNTFNDTVYMHPNKNGANRMLRVIYRWFVNNKPVVG